MIKDSTLTRLFANIFLLVVVLGAAFIGGHELWLGQAINPVIYAVVLTAFGSSIKLTGINAGIAFTKEDK